MEYKPLSELTVKINSGATPRGGKNVYTASGKYTLIRSQNIYNNYFYEEGLVYINNEQATKLKNVIVKEDDILINITGDSVARTSLVNLNVLPARINQHVMIIRCNTKLLYPQYLLAYLTASSTQKYLINIASSGATRPALTKKDIKEIEIPYISLKKQIKIGNILKNLNQKIGINNKIIANLEELSQTLFKRWFVDFEFPDENGNSYKSSGGKFVDTDGFILPVNWSVDSLDNIAQYTNGLAMQKYKPKDENDKLPVVKIKELKNGFVDDNSAFCTHSIPDKVKIFDGDIVFSWSATLLVDIWTGGPAGLNQHLFKVTSDKFQKWFYYYWTSFHNKNFIEIAKDKATTMGHINRKHLKEAKVFIPDEETLQKLDYQMSLYFREIVNINLQNKSLAELRDALLPKLMSGEIELPDELEVDEHAELLQ